MLAALLLEVSLFVAPLHLGAVPPESRAARAFLVASGPADGQDVEARREEAARTAQGLAQALRSGADFEELAARLAERSPGSGGGVLGTYFPGILVPEIDAFLFHAAEFEVSAPIATPVGFQVVQRLDRQAGCRMLLVAGHDAAARARAQELETELAAGADFAKLARLHSADAESAARGGALGIFERGPKDMLLKAATFRLKPGEVGGPIETPLGLHLVQRVDPTSLDPALADVNVVRVRMLLVAFRGARGAAFGLDRPHADAEALAQDLVRRVKAGEDLAELAALHDDDRGGRERRGDAGWIRRGIGQAAPVLDRAFLLPVGVLQDPIQTDEGFLILRRER